MSTTKPATRPDVVVIEGRTVLAADAARYRMLRAFMGRSHQQGYKGKARDRAALEFFCGVVSATIATDAEGVEYSPYTGLAFMVGVRGYSTVEDTAEQLEKAAADAWSI